MTAQTIRRGYKRMDPQVRCECGALATRQVWFWQLTPNHDRQVSSSLPLCQTCYESLLEFDSAVSDRPLME
jgi:hypothetical protein